MSEEILDLEMSLETANGLLAELKIVCADYYDLPLINELLVALPEVIRFVEARRAN